jgi:hypothetical protein
MNERLIASLWFLSMLFVGFDGNAQSQKYDAEAEKAGLMITEISWRGAFCVLNNCENNGAFSIRVKNISTQTEVKLRNTDVQREARVLMGGELAGSVHVSEVLLFSK